jgi:hypothetical protein
MTTALLALAAATTVVQAQNNQDEQREATIHASDHPLLGDFRWRSIGPAGQGGRVDDLAVRPDDPHTFFVGFATGVLWKTTNTGTTFRPVFATYGTPSIGDIAMAGSNPVIV